MKVLVIIKSTKSSEAGVMPDTQLLEAMGHYNEALVKAGIMLSGEGLHPSSNGIRVRFSGSDRMVTKGPFAETSELIAGFWMWRVKSMEEAIEWVKRCPNPMKEESEIEIRQVFEAADFGDAMTPELKEQEAGLRGATLGLSGIRFETKPPLLLSGLNGKYTMDNRHAIPQQWGRFVPYLGKIPTQKSMVTYGVSWNHQPECGFDYMTAVEVGDKKDLPKDFTSLDVPSIRWAIIPHQGPVGSIPRTLETIWSKWIPDSGLKPASGPCIESYSADFDPESNSGTVEIWVPIQT